MKRIWTYCRPMRWRMALEICVKFLGTVMDLLLPVILSYIINTVVLRSSVAQIALWGGVMLVCSVLALLGNMIANRMAADISRTVTRQLRHDLFAKIAALSCEQTDAVGIPSLEARITTDTYNVHQFINSMQRIGIRSPIIILGGIVIMATLDPVLALAMGVTLPLIVAVVLFVNHYGVPQYAKTQQAVDQLICTVRENCTGVRVIKALSKTKYEQARFAAVNDAVVQNEKRASILMAMSDPLMNVILNCALVGMVVLSAYRVNTGAVLPGTVIAFMTYFTIVLNALLSINRVFVMLSKGTASANRINRVLEMETAETPVLIPAQASPYHIEFENVCFSYKKKKKDLDNISFALKKGQTLGIIGATGCGKTTILNLLLRFYDADSGAVRINGVDVRSLPHSAVRENCGVVFQNDTLFADSVRENIRFCRALTDAEIAQAAKGAQADFIEALQGGMAFMLAPRGSNLSGGQKQRLMIARALAQKPEILILDDASSALDYKTDAALREALARNFAGTTTVIVAQRVSSILHADEILVLEEGRVLGRGTHSYLLQTCPTYREIAQTQMGGGSCA